MLCIAARYDTPKNGKPRHQLATTTANMAPSAVAMTAIGLLSSPRSISTLLKKPRPGEESNIHRQVSAMIAVEVMQGRRKRPREKFRHRQVTLRTRAIASPVRILRPTEATVKTRLL